MSSLGKVVGHDYAPGAEPTHVEAFVSLFGGLAATAITVVAAAIVLAVLFRVLASLLTPAPLAAEGEPEPAEPGPAPADSRALRKVREAERDEALFSYRPDPELRAERRVA